MASQSHNVSMGLESRNQTTHWQTALLLIPLLAMVFALMNTAAGWWAWVLYTGSTLVLYSFRQRWENTTNILQLFLCLLVLIFSMALNPKYLAQHHLDAMAFAAFASWIVLAAASGHGIWGGISTYATCLVGMLAIPHFHNWPLAAIVLLVAWIKGAQRYQMMVDFIKAERVLAELAITDPLTGLQNRRALTERFKKLHALCQRRHEPLLISLWDLNNLKTINDVQGHAAGDKYIKNFVNRLKGMVRISDELFRVGGDEFVGLHPGLDDGMKLYSRMEHNQSSMAVAVGWVEASADLEESLQRADAMMYAHKVSLKNGKPKSQTTLMLKASNIVSMFKKQVSNK